MHNSEAKANLLFVFEPGLYSFVAVEDIVSKSINHKKKHEYKMVVSQIVELLGKDVIKLFGTLFVHEILIAVFVLVSAVKMSPWFQKVFFSKGIIFCYVRSYQ